MRTIYGSEVEILDGDMDKGLVTYRRTLDGKLFQDRPLSNLIVPGGANEVRKAIMLARLRRCKR
jgi:hypothetical protein